MRTCSLAAILAVCLGMSSWLYAQTYQVLYNFSNENGGDDIDSPLVSDGAGNFYGTAFSGGASYQLHCEFWGGCGTVFKIDASGNKTTLHDFGLTKSDGQNPQAGVVRDSAGNLYGTTRYGGANGYGVVFKLDPSGNETILHTFTKDGDGAYLLGGLLLQPNGDIYGTAQQGGNLSVCTGQGCGTIFKITASGNFKVLHTFRGGTDGANPVAALITDHAGNFYGTASTRGTTQWGVVFKLDSNAQYTVLHSFVCGADDGGEPDAPLTRDSSGNLYGTTSYCGAQDIGTVFKIDTSGNTTVLHSFAGSAGLDGQYPEGGVILDSQGNLYGTAGIGGSFGSGVVYELTPDGQETILHNFAGPPSDGKEPDAELFRDNSGNLYGTSAIGGPGSCPIGCGTIFEITP